MSAAEVILGDCLDVMRGMPSNSVDAIVTDPPYGLKFMGIGWDSFATPKGTTGHNRAVSFDRVGGNHNPVDGFDKARTRLVEGRKFQAWSEVWAVEALRVLKPGAYMVAFGGTRTYHRLTCAIEEAGFDVQDSLCWLFGSGFPKHRSKLKPAHEPICLARKPAARATLLNVDACRIAINDVADPNREQHQQSNRVTWEGGTASGFKADHVQPLYNAEGRWPANVVLDEEAGALLDAMTGVLTSGARRPNVRANRGRDNVYKGACFPAVSVYERDADSGGASRFFYCSKASQAERWEYLSCDCEASRLRAWENEDRSRSAPTECTSPARAISVATSTGDSSSHTSPFGNGSTGECLTASKSITSTRTSKTTDSPTCGSSVRPNTSESTPGVSYAANNGGSPVASAASSSPSTPSTGTSRAKAGRSTGVAVPATSPRSSATSNCADCGNPLKRTGHPTVKPVALMRWLVRLVTPPNGVVLDPFTGSGTTGIACVQEGRAFIGIEREPEYVAMARARIAHHTPQQLEIIA